MLPFEGPVQRFAMISSIRSTLTLTVAVLLGGCSNATAPTTAVGTYALVRVNGFPLPASVGATAQTGPLGAPFWVRGTLELNADGSYTQTTTDSTRVGTVGTVTEGGRWASVAGDSVQFTTTTAGRESGKGAMAAGEIRRVAYTSEFVWQRR